MAARTGAIKDPGNPAFLTTRLKSVSLRRAGSTRRTSGGRLRAPAPLTAPSRRRAPRWLHCRRARFFGFFVWVRCNYITYVLTYTHM